MVKRLVATLTVAVALLLVVGGLGPAEARHGFGGWHGGHHFGGARFFAGRSFGARHFGHFRHGRHFGRSFFIGAPLVYGAYAYGPYYYGSGCYWLKRRALITGSPYWWHRYNACRYDYGY
jgi:hypothetical protein